MKEKNDLRKAVLPLSRVQELLGFLDVREFNDAVDGKYA